MNTWNRNLKFVVLLMVILLSSSLVAQHQPSANIFQSDMKVGELRWLKKKNFDMQFYDGTDSLINQYLFEALRNRKNGNLIRGAGITVTVFFPPLGALGIAYGSQEFAEGVEFLNAATIRRNDLLLGGKTFDGPELFRQEAQAKWFHRQNFHIDHYDGKSMVINNILGEAYEWRNRSRKQFRTGLATNLGGFGLMLMGLFSMVAGDGDSGEPILATGTLLHFSSYGFFISAFSKKHKARKLVNQASRQWYQQLNQNRSNAIKHLTD